MKRSIVFLILGPLFGLAISFAIVFPVALFLEGRRLDSKHLGLVLVSLPWAYLLGLMPAAIAGVADYLVRRMKFRGVFTFAVGTLVTLPIFIIYAPFSGKWNIVVSLVVGGLPAIICSWLSREKGA